MEDLKKEDLIKIIKDEINNYNSRELNKIISKEIKSKNSITHKEVVDIVKDALIEMNKFLWFRKEAWLGSIK